MGNDFFPLCEYKWLNLIRKTKFPKTAKTQWETSSQDSLALCSFWQILWFSTQLPLAVHCIPATGGGGVMSSIRVTHHAEHFKSHTPAVESACLWLNSRGAVWDSPSTDEEVAGEQQRSWADVYQWQAILDLLIGSPAALHEKWLNNFFLMLCQISSYFFFTV